MKTIQKISALLVASASFSMAGVINVYTGDKDPSTSLNLMTIDSLTFSGKADKKEIDISGKSEKNIKLSDIDRIEFSLKDKSKETMTVTVGEGIAAGKHTIKLSEIKNIEIVEMDSGEDKDSDGLTDLEEIYKYDTNPNSADTDGDGWSDSEELADGMYSPTNPTKFNPRIADVPGLMITLKKSPSIVLNVTTSEGKTVSESITEGKEVTNTYSTSYEQTRSAELMHAWNISTTQGWEVGGGAKAKWVGNVTVGYNGSYTSSTGMTWSSSEEKSVAHSYETARSKEKTEDREVSGATLCMQVELKNTSDIAFTIEGLKLSASTYDIKDSSTLKILAELSREGEWSDITLKPAESVNVNFCNNDVKVEQIENLIYNTNSIVLGSSTQKITFDGGNNDFTIAYTKVAAKTADITIDYGPGSVGNQSVRYQVATNYRYNLDHKGTDDLYAQTSLAELLRNAHVNFKQDSVEGPSKKKFYGLASIEGYEYSLADSAMWYVTIQRAAELKKGINTVELYTFANATYDIEKIFVGAGDAVHIFYSKDQDNDGIPLPTEHLFGTDDTKVDSDGDGLSDYDEITGWIKGESTVKIYTNPADADTDGDGLNDKEDPEPTKRAMFSDASLFSLQVFADSLMVDSMALLSIDSATFAADRAHPEVDIQAPSAYVKIVPNAKKVAWVRFTLGETMQYVQPTVEGDKDVYVFKTPVPLSVLHDNKFTIEVKSEDEAADERLPLHIRSTLSPPTNLKLGKSADRDTIIVNFDRSKDSRVKGYVILRGNWHTMDGKSLPLRIDKNTKLESSSTYNGYTPILIDADKNRYADYVGSGSPYYVYRVFAYGMEGDTTVFSEGTDQHRRSVGRIQMKYRMFDFGAEYLWFYDCAARADVSANVSLHAGANEAAGVHQSWYGFDWNSGLESEGNTVVFLSSEYDEGNDTKPNYDWNVVNIGSEGLYLYFDVSASTKNIFGKKCSSDHVRKGIRWDYSDIKNNNYKDQNGNIFTLKKGENRILVGKGGIDFDTDANGKCDNDCGDEPHTGYKFEFDYNWVDDDELY